jgi:hypothetical protein
VAEILRCPNPSYPSPCLPHPIPAPYAMCHRGFETKLQIMHNSIDEILRG